VGIVCRADHHPNRDQHLPRRDLCRIQRVLWPLSPIADRPVPGDNIRTRQCATSPRAPTRGSDSLETEVARRHSPRTEIPRDAADYQLKLITTPSTASCENNHPRRVPIHPVRRAQNTRNSLAGAGRDYASVSTAYSAWPRCSQSMPIMFQAAIRQIQGNKAFERDVMRFLLSPEGFVASDPTF
jgi:hypothetical protein